jgi:hypothetical protein
VPPSLDDQPSFANVAAAGLAQQANERIAKAAEVQRGLAVAPPAGRRTRVVARRRQSYPV